jgi:CheY-like chemotaxis protein
MNKKVLIVEDDQLLAYLMERYTINCGCDVIGNVDNGKDAILLAKTELPDYILMDIRIEGDIDGIETAILINESNDIKIIYISGNSDEKTFSRAQKTNMLAFLIKPIKQADLMKYLSIK